MSNKDDVLSDDEQEFMTTPGSIGEYVYGDCPQCALNGRKHIVVICRKCGAPPVADGCICDAVARRPMSKLLN
jgi:hypothetical protein